MFEAVILQKVICWDKGEFICPPFGKVTSELTLTVRWAFRMPVFDKSILVPPVVEYVFPRAVQRTKQHFQT